MPKGHFDWFSVATLWLGAAIMAIRAGDLPLVRGAPTVLTSSFWSYVPFGLISLYGLIALVKIRRGSHLNGVSAAELTSEAMQAHGFLSAPDDLDSGRIFLAPKFNPLDLMNLCEGKTSIHSKQAVQPYIGKWIRFRGSVKDVSRTHDGAMRILFELAFLRHLTFISQINAGMSEVIHIGDVVELVGKIESISKYDVYLVEAEVISR